MALPFLSKLFIREAEQVALKPMPASLANINLSASAKASAKEAGSNASMKATKKGTEIMMKKLIIWIVAGIVAVAAIAGTIVIIAKKVKRDSDPTKISRTHSDDDLLPLSQPKLRSGYHPKLYERGFTDTFQRT